MKKIIFYKDKRKEWRWKAVASNGKIIANSGEGYKRQQYCIDAFRKLRNPCFSFTTVIK